MRIAAFVLAFLSVACAAFASWGLGTADGRRAFDEMAGMVPLASAVAAGVLALAALLAWWRSIVRHRRARSTGR